MQASQLHARVTSRFHLGLALVLLATALLYLPALSGDFVSLDDYEYVKANADVRHPDLIRILGPATLTASDWTPVVTLSHVIEYRLFGLHPLPYHATNVLLHLTCTALLYLFLLDIGIDPGVAVLASLLFAIHPLQVESVAWVSSRKNLLAALFGLAFCRAFLSGRLVWASVLLVLALASKGTAVVFPLWAAVLVMGGAGVLRRRRAVPWLILFGVLALARGLLSARAQASVIVARAVGAMSFGDRMTIMGRVLAIQLRQFFWPSDLSMDYFWSPSGWSDPRVLLAWAVVVGVVGLVIRAARRDVRVAITGSFAGIALLPTLNILPGPDFQADRYLHLLFVGAGVLTVMLVYPLRRIHGWAPSIVLLLWTVLLVPITRARIAVWHNSETMWRDVLRRHPAFAFGWDSLAMYYLEQGDVKKAEPALRRALKVEPDLETARLNLALLLANRGSVAESIAELRALLAQHSSSVGGQDLLGRLLADQGADDEALTHLEAALRLDPADARARYQRARINARAGRLDVAAADFEELLRSNRASALLSGLASVRLQQQQVKPAIELAREAAERNTHDVEAWSVLGRAFASDGELDAAESALRRGVEANPAAADLWYQLAAIRHERGDRDGARAAAARALQQVGSSQPPWLDSARDLAR